jgi:hypothetical protein
VRNESNEGTVSVGRFKEGAGSLESSDSVVGDGSSNKDDPEDEDVDVEEDVDAEEDEGDDVVVNEND